MAAMAQGRLGVDLDHPEDQIVIQTIMHLHALTTQKKPNSITWVVANEAPYDAVICDVGSPLLTEISNGVDCPVLKVLKRGLHHGRINCLPRPLSAQALYAWLDRVSKVLYSEQSKK